VRHHNAHGCYCFFSVLSTNLLPTGAFYTPPEHTAKTIELVREDIARIPVENDYIILDIILQSLIQLIILLTTYLLRGNLYFAGYALLPVQATPSVFHEARIYNINYGVLKNELKKEFPVWAV
jgi:hypothetical protein